MTRITLQTFEEMIDSFDMGTGESLVVGRNPSRNDGDGALQIPLTSMSSNHVRIAVGEAAARITDLGSKNGTWLRLPPHVPVDVSPSAAVQLYVGVLESPGQHDELPADAAWSNVDEFPTAVSRVVEDWLAQRGLPVRVAMAARATRRGDTEHPGHIPLAAPVDLHIVPLQTTDARWPELLAQVWRYVARQNDLFATEQELRQDGIVLASPVMRRIYRSVIDAARRGLRLLLMGPSGAGKEMLARCYHRHSGRDGAFVARNCAMMTKDFLRVELFGAERGAFTGSVHRITGAVERAQGGTLFLDEIGELAPDLQAMLLRFLDSGEYERLGQFGQPSHSDTRVVCATNRDLRAACAKGEFRSDLWYRLSIKVIEVPPLRERIEDIIAYLRSYPTGDGVTAFDLLGSDAVDLIRTYAWDGNFRELANFAERMPRDARRGSIDRDACLHLLSQGALSAVRPRPPLTAEPGSWGDLAARAETAFREDHIEQPPQSWDEVKEYIEKYLKPLLFAHLSGAASGRDVSDVRAHAERMGADRATAMKQLERYFDRFSK